MYISNLKIKGFRNFPEVPFEIALRPFTLILGENNIGKTNIVSATSLIFGQEISTHQTRRLGIDDINYAAVQRFKREVAEVDRADSDIEFPEVVVEAELAGMNENQHAVVGDWYTDKSLEKASVTYRYALRGNFNWKKWVEDQRGVLADRRESVSEEQLIDYVDFPIGEYRHTIYGGRNPSNECETHLLRMLRGEFLDALRDANRELVAGGEQRLLYRVLSSFGDAEYADLKKSLSEVEGAVNTNKAIGELKVKVAGLLERVSLLTKGANNSIGFQFTAPDTAELLKKIGLLYGADPVTVDRNGLGRNNLLYLALVISQIARTDIPSDGHENYACFRVVAVEEPEAHLHPHLQDHLAGNIESVRKEHDESLQLLLTSHSTHLAARLDLENTVVVFRDAEGELTSRYVLEGIDAEKEAAAIRFLTLYLDATKSRLLFARSVILVEGIAEQAVVPLLFEREYKIRLEQFGCSVVNVNGIAFRNFLNLFKRGLFRTCVVLTDSDSKTVTKQRASKLKTDFHDGNSIHVQISGCTTFEKDLVDVNKTGDGRDILLDALKKARPRKGKEYAKKVEAEALDPDGFFEALGKEKAAFAFNVAIGLKAKPDADFAVPPYIVAGFEAIAGKKPEAKPAKKVPKK